MSKETSSKPFSFKQFVIEQDKVAMKVGTDGVLVGAWADISNKKKILDIGTGSGLIALMLAQRIGSLAEVHAIDVDDNSITQAKRNFSNSIWKDSFVLHHNSIQEYSFSTSDKFDLIISNPPFFNGSLVSNNETRTDARHTTKLPHGDLLQSVDRLLEKDGHLILILPYLQGLRFMEISEIYKLFSQKITEVFSKPNKPIERLLIQLGREKCIPRTNQLIIQDESNNYTADYISLTKDFYLDF